MVQFVKFRITPVHHHQSQQDATLDRFILSLLVAATRGDGGTKASTQHPGDDGSERLLLMGSIPPC